MSIILLGALNYFIWIGSIVYYAKVYNPIICSPECECSTRV